MSKKTQALKQAKKRKKPSKAYLTRVLLAWASVILWMTFIFVMSAQPVEESHETSTEVSEGIAGTVTPGFQEMPPEQKVETVEKFDIVVRKLAHFAEFGLLGVLFYTAVVATRNKLDINWLIVEGSMIFVLAYAATDELHQKYVPGRIASIRDVAIDCLGALAGVAGTVALTAIIAFIIKKRKKAEAEK